MKSYLQAPACCTVAILALGGLCNGAAWSQGAPAAGAPAARAPAARSVSVPATVQPAAPGFVASSGQAVSNDDGDHLVPLFPSAADTLGEGFVRVINRSGNPGEVRIAAIDDAGMRIASPVLAIDPNETRHFNSKDLEQGNPDKGLSSGTGAGQGDWRLELNSELDIEVLGYIRTPDGFLTAMHDVVEPGLDGHRVSIFNPGSNRRQKSLLRLINPLAESVDVRISGTDDAGIPADTVTLTLPAGGARTMSAAELESAGNRVAAQDGPGDEPPLDGELGTGTGKWQLQVDAGQPVVVMSLMMSPAGHRTNLSTAGVTQTRAAPPPVERDPRLDPLKLPEGFQIRIVSSEVGNARQMALAADGTLYVGTLRQGGGRVYGLPRALSDEQPQVIAIARGLVMPSGLAVRGDTLYVAALNRVLHFANVGQRLEQDAAFEVVTDRLPDARHHGWKYIKFGPDGQLYVPVGAPCNICSSDDPRFAALLRMDPASGATGIVAEGIRNSVGFAWHPLTRNLWFTDNGRDHMGDDVPPDEINEITGAGQHFGYPFIHGADVLDPTFGGGKDPADYTPPVVAVQAHAAVLGAAFYTGGQFPARYRNALFVAEHGSWNRSRKVGYQVSVVVFEDGEPRYEPFITGWLQGERNWGRPNDVLVAPDGSLLVSDDQFGAIYQVTYSGN